MLTIDQRLLRVEARLEELDLWRDRAFVDLDGWTFDGAPLALGHPWPDTDGVHRFDHPPVEAPDGWRLDDVRLDIDLGGEGLLRLRYEDGRGEAFGTDRYHRRFPLLGSRFSIEAEAVARLPFGVPNLDARLARARLARVDPEVARLHRRLSLVLEAARALGSDEVVDALVGCAEQALTVLDWPSATEHYVARNVPSKPMIGAPMEGIWALPELEAHPPGLDDAARESVAAAGERLQRELDELREQHPQRGLMALSGHAHLDLAWLWPLEETRRKAQRTYHTVTGLLERYPEFTFNQSSAQLYRFIEEDDPELFARIKDAVAAGRWEPIGGMWVEPDMNMPSGESLVRQLLYGQRYFKATFGRTHRVCWLPDCFGFSPGLPQLLKTAGIDYFFTHKMNWSETNRFPHDLFWWEGIDGSRVLAHGFNNPDGGYNGRLGPRAMHGTWRNFRGRNRRRAESLLTIGYGDGGGGPTAEMLERGRDLDGFPALPAHRFGSIEDFYDRAASSAEDEPLPTWVGELYLEMHRGTLTTQGRLKYLHRRAERDIVAAEVLGALDALLGGDEPPSLEHLWQVVLRNEFHDILPGSSIREVNEQAENELGAVVDEARGVLDEHLEALAGRAVTPGSGDAVLVVNPDLSPRPLRVELDAEVPGAQPVDGGSVIADDRSLPGLGIQVLTDPSPPTGLEASAHELENRFLKVSFADDGTLESIRDKRAGRDVIDGRGNQLWAHVDKPRAWDAWDIDAGYADAGEEVTSLESMKVVEAGPHRAAIRIERRFRNSRITQDVRLWANSPRLEFKTSLDWNDRRWLLKARWPLAVRSTHADFETAFGIVERPTHRNTSWQAAQFEVAGHRFVDLSEPGYGVALLNDGRYGHHAVGNELGLTLLRSPSYPDPFADEGHQIFTYALVPHEGDWLQGGVLAEAEDLNRPLLARRVKSGGQSQVRPLRVEGLPVGLGALKSLEDGGGLVLRVYEPRGARGEVRVELPTGWSLDSELDLLEGDAGEPQLFLSPFKVRSWRLSTHA